MKNHSKHEHVESCSSANRVKRSLLQHHLCCDRVCSRSKYIFSVLCFSICVINCDFLDLQNYHLNWKKSCLRMVVKFKRDQLNCCWLANQSSNQLNVAALTWVSQNKWVSLKTADFVCRLLFSLLSCSGGFQTDENRALWLLHFLRGWKRNWTDNMALPVSKPVNCKHSEMQFT